MDPLSITASIVGIAAAGIAVAKTIYEVISSARGASRELSDIARSIANLSRILRELGRVLKECDQVWNRKMLRCIKSTMRRISKIHDEIYGMIRGIQGFASLKWRFKRSDVQFKLTRIESHKTGINLMLNILLLAMEKRKKSE